MNIQSSALTPYSHKLNTQPQARQAGEGTPEERDKPVDIDWSSACCSAAIGAAYAGVPAALELVGQAAGYPGIGGVIGIAGAAFTAAILRPGPGALLVSTMTATLGVHGALQFGLAGGIGATLFTGTGMGLANLQDQMRA